ncbi:hypothetical protein EAT51_07815 [Pseudoxanthomonas winnipegensis]|nr:hypothetical protein EAT51_07815 [Pseudoxanthomonas winnipegensis]
MPLAGVVVGVTSAASISNGLHLKKNCSHLACASQGVEVAQGGEAEWRIRRHAHMVLRGKNQEYVSRGRP